MTREMLLALLGVALVLAALVGGIPVLSRGRSGPVSPWAARGEGFAVGVFLGAGLVHILPDAQVGFVAVGSTFPWAFAICGAVLLAFTILERRTIDEAAKFVVLPVVSTAILAVHSFLAGAALGATDSRAAIITLSVALAAHKTAAAFALATLLMRSSLSPRATRVAFGVFVAALPLGILSGDAILSQQHVWPLAIPTIMALGAGAFLCLAVRHGHHDSQRLSASAWAATILGYVFMVGVAVFA